MVPGLSKNWVVPYTVKNAESIIGIVCMYIYNIIYRLYIILYIKHK